MSAALGASVHAVLHGREDLRGDVLACRDLPRHLGELTSVMVAGAALYGAVLGMWRSPLLAAYVAIKLPLVLLATSSITMLLNWMLAALLGVPLRLLQVMVLTFLALATSATLLAAVAPIAWLFTAATPSPTPEAITAHHALFLIHTLLVGGASLAGTVSLWRLLARFSPTRAQAQRVYAAWLLAFALVGGEVSWILRPFVGSVSLPVVFLRANAFELNLYEFLLTEILPRLFGARS